MGCAAVLEQQDVFDSIAVKGRSRNLNQLLPHTVGLLDTQSVLSQSLDDQPPFVAKFTPSDLVKI
jgi:hypothetical protein